MKLDYDNMSDNELVDYASNKDDSDAMEYLLKKHGNIVRRETRTVFMLGAENDDLVQEGMIGLFKAIKTYENDKGAGFTTFATLCVRNQIKTAISASNRKKHNPLNDYLSIYAESDDSGSILDEIVSRDVMSNPEKVVIAKEEKKDMDNKVDSKLSKLEKNILTLYLDGLSYIEIADITGKSPKAVDNALQRVRAKLTK